MVLFGLYSADSQTCLSPSPTLAPQPSKPLQLLRILLGKDVSLPCQIPSRDPAHSWIPGRQVLSDRWLLWCMPGCPTISAQMHTHHHQQHVQTTRLDLFWSSTCAGPPPPPDPLMSTSEYICLHSFTSWGDKKAISDVSPRSIRLASKTFSLRNTEMTGAVIHPVFFFFFKNEHLYFFFFYFSAVPHGMQGLSFPTKDWTCGPCREVQHLNHWTTRKEHSIHSQSHLN